MVGTKNIFIMNGDIKLETEIYESNTDEKSSIVICHPHPQII